MTRQKKECEYTYLWNTTIPELLNDVEKIKELYHDVSDTDIFISEKDYDYQDGSYTALLFYRLETDEEMTKREESQKKAQEALKDYKRKQLEALKKEFGES